MDQNIKESAVKNEPVESNDRPVCNKSNFDISVKQEQMEVQVDVQNSFEDNLHPVYVNNVIFIKEEPGKFCDEFLCIENNFDRAVKLEQDDIDGAKAGCSKPQEDTFNSEESCSISSSIFDFVETSIGSTYDRIVTEQQEFDNQVASQNSIALKELNCPYCDFQTCLKGRYKRHALTHSNPMNPEFILKCSECEYTTKMKGNLKLHLLTHSNKKLYKCLKCEYECNYKNSLKLHSLSHSNSKLLKCSECDYECNQKRDLTRHMVAHSKEFFRCSECNYGCNEKSKLKVHSLTHSNIKLFTCSECNYKSNYRGDIKRHSLTHSKTKLFKCPQCSYECNLRYKLKLHNLIHTDIKLFQCSECDYKCNQRINLRCHMRKHMKRN